MMNDSLLDAYSRGTTIVISSTVIIIFTRILRQYPAREQQHKYNIEFPHCAAGALLVTKCCCNYLYFMIISSELNTT